MSAATLRLDAVRMIKTVLAGTATKHFTDVIKAVFGGAEDKSVKKAMETEEGIPLMTMTMMKRKKTLPVNQLLNPAFQLYQKP